MRLTCGRTTQILLARPVRRPPPRAAPCSTACRTMARTIWMLGDTSPVAQDPPPLSTLEIVVMVFQLRVVAGTPKIRSTVPR
jgi:hypothetical protein